MITAIISITLVCFGIRWLFSLACWHDLPAAAGFIGFRRDNHGTFQAFGQAEGLRSAALLMGLGFCLSFLSGGNPNLVSPSKSGSQTHGVVESSSSQLIQSPSSSGEKSSNPGTQIPAKLINLVSPDLRTLAGRRSETSSENRSTSLAETGDVTHLARPQIDTWQEPQSIQELSPQLPKVGSRTAIQLSPQVARAMPIGIQVQNVSDQDQTKSLSPGSSIGVEDENRNANPREIRAALPIVEQSAPPGKFMGLGVILEDSGDGGVVVEAVIQGSPADRAHIPIRASILRVNRVRDFFDARSCGKSLRDSESPLILEFKQHGQPKSTIITIYKEPIANDE